MRIPNRIENAIAAAKFGEYAHIALHASAGTYPSMPGVAYALKPGVHVSGGRSSENDALDGSAMDIVGRSNERGGMLGSKSLLRRAGGAIERGGDVMAA